MNYTFLFVSIPLICIWLFEPSLFFFNSVEMFFEPVKVLYKLRVNIIIIK